MILSVKELKKRYGKVEALRGISFEVEEGEIYGLIGPDGAGKTTLFRILTTLLLADGGTATVDGLDVVTHTRRFANGSAICPVVSRSIKTYR